MGILPSNPFQRKVVALTALFSVASILLHLKIFSRRSAKYTRIGRKSENETPKESFHVSAIIPEEYLSNTSNISRHNFDYLVKPRSGQLCINEANRAKTEQFGGNVKKIRRLLVLFLIHSKAEHFEYRKVIRETWASVGKRLTQVVFLLGNPENHTLQHQIEKEQDKFGDLLQEDFRESYRNITLKNIMGLKWASQYCSSAKYVVKVDDDMFVNSKMLISSLINSRFPKKDLILCKIHFFKDVPREGKYIIDRSLYSADYWPSFCFGGCWIVSMDVVRRLYEISVQTKQIYLDDVYVTGILRTKLSLPISYMSKAYKVFCHTRGNYTMVRDMWDSLEASKYEKNLKHVKPYVKYWTTCFT